MHLTHFSLRHSNTFPNRISYLPRKKKKISFADFLLERGKRYNTFMDAFLEYQKDIGGLDLEAMEANYRILFQFHDNEDKQSDDEEEGNTQCSGVKGGDFDFGNYALDDESAMDCSSLFSDYAASQMLQASIEAHLESHLGRICYFYKSVKTGPAVREFIFINKYHI